VESFDLEFAAKTRKRYVCSVCWGELELIPDIRENGKYFVLCRKCKDETRGYVTLYFVTRRRGESEGEKVNVVHLMQKLGLIENPLKGVSREAIIHSLGF
jgi:hypothetical protein